MGLTQRLASPPTSAPNSRAQTSHRGTLNQRSASGALTDRLIGNLEEKIRLQKKDKFERSETLPQRLNCLARINALADDIDARYAATRAEQKLRKQFAARVEGPGAGASAPADEGSKVEAPRGDDQLSVTSSTTQASSSLGSICALRRQGGGPLDAEKTNFLQWRLPDDLRAGTSFCLWPAKSYGSSTALRLGDRASESALLSAEVAARTSSTRWELDGALK